MYHIKNDKRVFKSAQLICNGLADILQTSPYEVISISDVCSSAGISRATFYRLFDTLDDVLLYQFDNLFDQAIRKYKEINTVKITYSKLILNLAVSNKTLITAILKSGRYDIFYFSTRKKEKELIEPLNMQLSTKELLYCTPLLNQILFSVLHIWLENGCKEDSEQLYAFLKRELKIISEYI